MAIGCLVCGHGHRRALSRFLNPPGFHVGVCFVFPLFLVILVPLTSAAASYPCWKSTPGCPSWEQSCGRAGISLKDGNFSSFDWNWEHDSGILYGLILWSLKGKETQERVLFCQAVPCDSLRRNAGNQSSGSASSASCTCSQGILLLIPRSQGFLSGNGKISCLGEDSTEIPSRLPTSCCFKAYSKLYL